MQMKKFILTLIVGLMSVVGLAAPKNSPWKEIQSVEIPSSVEILEGHTRTGNPKYWIVIDEDVCVSVSPSNVEKLREGKTTLELVKWQNVENGKFKYSTRQCKDSVSSNRKNKNIDLKRVF